MATKRKVEHPFAKKDPKPTRARLVGLLDPLGRRRYAEVERFLAGISGATSGLYYYGTQGGEPWGWAVRYLMSDKTALCTLHLLPETFETTITANKEMQEAVKSAGLSAETRRRIGRCRVSAGARWIRLPLKNDADFRAFKIIIQLKSDCRRSGKTSAGNTAKTKAKAKAKTKIKAKKATA